MQHIAIPEQYAIYQQDLTQQHLQLKLMGTVRNINEAKTMCKVFNETDIDVKKGNHTYIFVCAKIKGEN